MSSALGHTRAAPNALHYRAEVFSVGKSEQNIKICLISCDICLMLLNDYFDTETTVHVLQVLHTQEPLILDTIHN